MDQHTHYKSMADYAEDARTNSKPWTLWETRSSITGCGWRDCNFTPVWAVSTFYRRKAVPKKYVTINGVDVEDDRIHEVRAYIDICRRSVPCLEVKAYVEDAATIKYVCVTALRNSDQYQQELAYRGILHKTRHGAEAFCRARLGDYLSNKKR